MIRSSNLSEVQKHFLELYRTRNFFVSGSFPERVVRMTRRISRVADAKRKNENVAIRLARTASYLMSLVNYFNGEVDLTRGMMTKFPSFGCAYCLHKPCTCDATTRPNPKEIELDQKQLLWSIRDWQKHLQEVYGEKNTQRGFWEILGRLMSEFGELSILNAYGPQTPILPSKILKECESESADIFGWILAIAYTEGIDIQSEIENHYEVCPGCEKIPCDCPVVFISQDGKHFSTANSIAIDTF